MASDLAPPSHWTDSAQIIADDVRLANIAAPPPPPYGVYESTLWPSARSTTPPVRAPHAVTSMPLVAQAVARHVAREAQLVAVARGTAPRPDAATLAAALAAAQRARAAAAEERAAAKAQPRSKSFGARIVGRDSFGARVVQIASSTSTPTSRAADGLPAGGARKPGKTGPSG